MSEPRESRNKTICTAATAREKAAFEQFCADHDTRPAQMLRLMLSRVCNGIEPGDLPKRVTLETPLFVRVSPDEAKSVRAQAKAESTTPQGWIRRLIRTALHNSPQFTRQEENALLESNRELAHLGRNINQIAHQLNISLNAADLASAQRLEALAKEIEAHKDRVYAVINASWGRYGGKEK